MLKEERNTKEHMRHKILVTLFILAVASIAIGAKAKTEETRETVVSEKQYLPEEAYYCNQVKEVFSTIEDIVEERTPLEEAIFENTRFNEEEREARIATFVAGKTSDMDVEEIDIFYIEEEQKEYYCAQVLEILATGYCICEECCEKTPEDDWYGITASGYNLLSVEEPRIVAADTDILPFGTKIYIEVPEMSRDKKYVTEDFGIATVEDRGGAIKGARIDIFFPSHQEGDDWGKRNVNVYVLEPLS